MRILLIEDDPAYLSSIIDNIKDTYIVDAAFDSNDASYLSAINDYDLIYLDCSLPDKQGLDLCKDLRSKNKDVPILMALDAPDSSLRIKSLENGADVLLNKPFDPRELQLNCNLILERKYKLKSHILRFSKLELNLRTKSVFVSGKRVSLRRREYEILQYLVLNQGNIVSQEELSEHIWSPDCALMSNAVEVHIKNLRDKIEKPFGFKIISTVYGLGYRI